MRHTKTHHAATRMYSLLAKREPVVYAEATNLQRFINYLVDNLLMQLLINWSFTSVLVYAATFVSPDRTYFSFIADSRLMTGLLFGIFNLLLYYTICEKVFNGKTAGTWISGTRAIREDGDELTWQDALLRSLCRLIPLEGFSIWLGYGLWHDVWTKTKVVQSK
jgi:uncharacterized RDD family membrane protein YckC